MRLIYSLAHLLACLLTYSLTYLLTAWQAVKAAGGAIDEDSGLYMPPGSEGCSVLSVAQANQVHIHIYIYIYVYIYIWC